MEHKITINNRNDNPCFGWILQDYPNFWEDNGYKQIKSDNYHYHGCTAAKCNKVPVYKKQLYINSDYEEESSVEVFRCDYGSICHDYVVAIHSWNNAGGTGFSLRIATQVSTIDAFNDLIMEYIGDKLEDGTYLLERHPKTKEE